MSCTWIDFYGRRGRLLLLKSTKRHHPALPHSAIGKNLFVLSNLCAVGAQLPSRLSIFHPSLPCPRSNPARACLLSHASRGCTPGQCLQPSSPSPLFCVMIFFIGRSALLSFVGQQSRNIKRYLPSNVFCWCNLQSINSKKSRAGGQASSLPMDGQRVVSSNFLKVKTRSCCYPISKRDRLSFSMDVLFTFARSDTVVAHPPPPSLLLLKYME